MTPSSPKVPCNAIKTKSCAFKSFKIRSIESESRTNIEVLWPNWLQAKATASPVLIETNRSSEFPPDITAILILYPLLLQVNYLILNQHCN